MRPLDHSALDVLAPQLDLAVGRSVDVDHFCSSSAWTFSADRALTPGRSLFVRQTEDGWVSFARARHPRGRHVLEPLEAAWCLGSPLVCDGNPARFARDLATWLAQEAPADAVFLAGLVESSPLFVAIAGALDRTYALGIDIIPPTRRFRASLEGGIDGFLSRRSPTFRTRLRQALRKAGSRGLRFEPIVARDDASADALYARLLAVEARSWKGLASEGLAVPEMRAFYAEMLPRLARSGALRAQVGVLDESDVAMIVGAVVTTPGGLVHRGLQFSFDDAHAALSLGNLAQLAQITALMEEGGALYDLGSEVDYKRRWGEQCFETVTLVAIPRR